VKNSEKVNPVKRVPCLFCNKTFASPSSLSNHKKRCKMQDEDISEIVNFATPQKHHKNTKNSLFHSNNEESQQKRFICGYCYRDNFKHQQNLSRHMKTCGKKVELERKTEDLQKQVDLLLKENKNLLSNKEEWLRDKEQLNKDKESLSKDKDKFADLATTNSNLIKTSISAMKYFMTNFQNTPALTSIEDISTIKNNKDNTTFIKHLISMYRNDNLAAYIGEYIVNIYKTTDSSKQTVWSSDVDRLTYIISEAVAKDKTTWVTDKKGITVGERVIKPALKYIKPLLQKFIVECGTEVMTDNVTDRRQMELIEFQKCASHIMVLIDNKVLEKDIIKYIAPMLYWNKNTLLEDEVGNIKSVKAKKISKLVKNDNKLKSSKPIKHINIINPPKANKVVKQTRNATIVLSDDSDLVDSDEELVDEQY
jgi:hypothetical protein